MAHTYRVGVVGFGVAGAAVSALLARAGHHVTLFERAPRVGPVGAGILLQPSGQEVLRRMGLLEKTVAAAEPIDELRALTHRGGTLLHIPYNVLGPDVRAYGLHRGDLFEVLRQAVLDAGVEVRLDHEMHSARRDGGQAMLLDVRGDVHGPFDFVLAGDGSRSQLRGRGRLRKHVHEYAYGALWLVGQCRAVTRRLHQVTRGTSHLLGLLPTGGGRCSLFWGLHRDQKDALLAGGVPAWKDQVLRLCPLAEEMFDGLTDFGRVVWATYQHVALQRWYDDHVLYLGDAGHAMSPHLGQGVNLALLDAFVFADALSRAPNFRTACQEYARRRTGHLRFYAWVTFAMTPFFQADGVVKGWGRDVALPLMPRLPWLRRQMALTMAGLKSGFLGGRLRL